MITNPLPRTKKSSFIRLSPSKWIGLLMMACMLFIMCQNSSKQQDPILELSKIGLKAEIISAADFLKGIAPANFQDLSGAAYKPSFNQEPSIPPQCWIETGYGTQNACKYCHNDYLAYIGHGNNFPSSEFQVIYSFPSPNLNRVLWRNLIYPNEIVERLKSEGIELPIAEELDYIRTCNWKETFQLARSNGNTQWLNKEGTPEHLWLFPALDPNHLFPYDAQNPTGNGTHGYIDIEGFIKDQNDMYTGWRAINFFPYAIFTPLSGSVSGIYIRLPFEFQTLNGNFNADIYKQNLDILEKNIKNLSPASNYVGDAAHIAVKKGFYPKSTEFAHPLHYVDLNADGQMGENIDGVVARNGKQYEFPGTRSKRVKEIRYMYKWKEVELADIAPDEDEEEGYATFIGKEGQGWIDNGAGWILAAFIENRQGKLRPQTTEELAQCLGCHSAVGNTIDAVWSFQRKLPGDKGWAEMNYGHYNSKTPHKTKLEDYYYHDTPWGEMGYFFRTVVGADLYGVMPLEIENELKEFFVKNQSSGKLTLNFELEEVFNQERLKTLNKEERMTRLKDRQILMRQYVDKLAYLQYDPIDKAWYIKGNVFYPQPETAKNNAALYRRIVLDQSFNLGKDVFGSEAHQVPFTFRSDGSVLDENNQIIPVGEVITSRKFNKEGTGTTPTGIAGTNEYREVIDSQGKVIDIKRKPEDAQGHISSGGTFDPFYNPILSGRSIRPE